MSGTAKKMLETIVERRAKGNITVALSTKTRLALRGFDPDCFSSDTPDDPQVIAQIRQVATDMGVPL